MSHTHTSLTYPTLALAFFFLTVVSAEIRTIDDTYGDSVTGALPAYSDTNCWNPNPCSICTLQPNASRAYNGTWHDTTSNACRSEDAASAMEANHSVSFSFHGTSLEIYVIIVSEGPLSWPTNLTFVLDGDISHTTYPNNSDSDTYQFRYDTLIFSNWSLSNAPHTFAMTAMQGWSRSVVLFDYATYTYEEPVSTSSIQPGTTVNVMSISPKPSGSVLKGTTPQTASPAADTTDTGHGSTGSHVKPSSVPIGGVVGGILGGVALVLLCTVATVYIRRRKGQDYAHHLRRSELAIIPYTLCYHGGLSDKADHTEGSYSVARAEASLSSSSMILHTDVHYDTLVREMQRIQREIRALRSNQMIAVTPDLEPTRDTAVMRRLDDDIEAELRNEIAVLRTELARLQRETEGLRDLPPAYH